MKKNNWLVFVYVLGEIAGLWGIAWLIKLPIETRSIGFWVSVILSATVSFGSMIHALHAISPFWWRERVKATGATSTSAEGLDEAFESRRPRPSCQKSKPYDWAEDDLDGLGHQDVE